MHDHIPLRSSYFSGVLMVEIKRINPQILIAYLHCQYEKYNVKFSSTLGKKALST